MAKEVNDAGKFDMQTNMDERRATLEALLQDETRLALAANDAPTWPELNAQLARGPKELEFFNRLDSEMTWYDPLDDIPYWIQYTAQDVRLALDVCQKGTSKTGILAQEVARANGTKPVKAFNPFTSGISRGGSAAGGGERGRGRGRGRPPTAGRGRGGRGAGRSSFAADLASAVLFPEEDDGGDFSMDLGFLPTAPVPLSSARGVVMDAPAQDDEGDEDVGENPDGDDDMEEEVIDANIRDEDVVTEVGPSTSLPADSTAVSSGVAGLGLVVGSDELGDLGDLGILAVWMWMIWMWQTF
ncbi:hypothetical protein CEUSTIGMA_g6884.t1 [Chlamydomonas eustigma]|uniref:Uncharacterized protein n=1 Tax=Chlamydomonas eustigma TaxID=1157962 RepID=A0A250X8P4_9CHLO|nr:hypothetical protein CEUSTIGMA_g6884.t1 [Chlamydomonas eustigma]|eukprot:GAX79443.1 hypothetical protein CEUSTIGMA_g6884.t1 [Chlamydomonas eustigma]